MNCFVLQLVVVWTLKKLVSLKNRALTFRGGFFGPQGTFLINPNIVLCHAFSLNAYEYPKFHQHLYFDNRLKNHRLIDLAMFSSYYQL